MEIILLGIYAFFAWLVFFKFKWLPWNFTTQVITVTLPIVGLMVLFLLLNIAAPATNDVRAMNYVIPIVPRITGQVTEVPIQPNRPMQFSALATSGAGRRADLEQAQSDLGNLESEFLAADATEAQARAQIIKSEADLRSAKYDLEGCVHLAPANGRVANLALQPGVRATQFATMPVMSFIQEDDPWLLAFYRQNELRFVKPGEEAEIFMKMYPGRIIKCKVDSILWATAQGQLPISGNLPNTQPMVAPEQRIAVRLLTDGTDKDVFLATGARGQGTIYTEEHQMIQLIRRVIVRIQAKLDWFVIKHLSALFGGH